MNRARAAGVSPCSRTGPGSNVCLSRVGRGARPGRCARCCFRWCASGWCRDQRVHGRCRGDATAAMYSTVSLLASCRLLSPRCAGTPCGGGARLMAGDSRPSEGRGEDPSIPRPWVLPSRTHARTRRCEPWVLIHRWPVIPSTLCLRAPPATPRIAARESSARTSVWCCRPLLARPQCRRSRHRRRLPALSPVAPLAF